MERLQGYLKGKKEPQTAIECEELVRPFVYKIEELTAHNYIKDQRIAELEEQLKNMFTPKFKKGQEVWFVNNKTQIAPIKVIIGDIHFCWQSKNKFFYDGNMRLNFYEGLPENELFNTREEALAKLEELKGENK